MDRQELAARRYCRACLEIMDGSFEKGLARIGVERFEKMVQDVINALPRTARCMERNKETGQCELALKHNGKHLAGYLMW